MIYALKPEAFILQCPAPASGLVPLNRRGVVGFLRSFGLGFGILWLIEFGVLGLGPNNHM